MLVCVLLFLLQFKSNLCNFRSSTIFVVILYLFFFRILFFNIRSKGYVSFSWISFISVSVCFGHMNMFLTTSRSPISSCFGLISYLNVKIFFSFSRNFSHFHTCFTYCYITHQLLNFHIIYSFIVFVTFFSTYFRVIIFQY